MPNFEVVVVALPRACVREIEEDGGHGPLIILLIPLVNLAEENEFLRCRVGDCGQTADAHFDSEVIFVPV